MSIQPAGKSCSDLGRAHVLNDPPGRLWRVRDLKLLGGVSDRGGGSDRGAAEDRRLWFTKLQAGELTQ
jgi:hypothetical protein